MGAYNETTGEAYRGKNVMRLLVAEAEGNYSDDHGWAGFHQWIKAGRVVRKGEHGTSCMTVVKVGGDSEGKGAKTAPRGFRVFHFDQTAELGAETPAETTPLAPGYNPEEAPIYALDGGVSFPSVTL